MAPEGQSISLTQSLIQASEYVKIVAIIFKVCTGCGRRYTESPNAQVFLLTCRGQRDIGDPLERLRNRTTL